MAAKRGEAPGAPASVKRVAESMSEEQLGHYQNSEEGLPEHAKSSAMIDRLHAARNASDQGYMVRKALLLSALMRENPGDWIVDSDPREPYPGVTHVPTGYRFHAPQRIIPPQLLEPAMAHALARAQGLEKEAGCQKALAAALCKFAASQDKPGGLDWGWGLAGYPAAALGQATASTGYLAGLPAYNRAAHGAAERRMSRDLVNMMTDRGYGVFDPRMERTFPAVLDPGGVRRSAVVSRAGMGDNIWQAFQELRSRKGLQNAAGSDLKGMAFVRRGTNPSILAHEAGHVLQHPGLLGTSMVSRKGPVAGLLGTLLSDDKDTGRNWALGGSLAGLPMVGVEMDASRRGAKLLKGMGAGFKSRLGAYAGVPTYALFAAMPWLVHKFKGMAGGYNND